jgi:predicted Zn-dependent protease
MGWSGRIECVVPMAAREVRMNRLLHTAVATAALLGSLALPLQAQTRIQPGFNLFNTSQDQQLGQTSAAQIERQVPILKSGAAARLVSSIGARLAAHAPGPKFNYRFKVVNASDWNAFALPGGYVYVNRGLIEGVQTEGQLAGVIAHEIAHVAVRHPTSRASKAYAGQAGASLVLGALFGGSSENTRNLASVVGGLGLQSLMLKNSRSMETEADVLGAQIMARAGYNPNEMATFFERMRAKQGRDPSAVAQFFSDHPSPSNRVSRVRQEARMLNTRGRASVGGLATAQRELNALADAPTLAQLTRGTARSLR